MKVKGYIKRQAVTILINSGSTNNVLDNTLAKKLVCHIEASKTFEVKVIDGRSLASTWKCPIVKNSV